MNERQESGQEGVKTRGRRVENHRWVSNGKVRDSLSGVGKWRKRRRKEINRKEVRKEEERRKGRSGGSEQKGKRWSGS